MVKPITSSVGERSVKPFSVSLRKYKACNRPRQLLVRGAGAETSIVLSGTTIAAAGGDSGAGRQTTCQRADPSRTFPGCFHVCTETNHRDFFFRKTLGL